MQCGEQPDRRVAVLDRRDGDHDRQHQPVTVDGDVVFAAVGLLAGVEPAGGVGAVARNAFGVEIRWEPPQF